MWGVTPHLFISKRLWLSHCKPDIQRRLLFSNASERKHFSDKEIKVLREPLKYIKPSTPPESKPWIIFLNTTLNHPLMSAVSDLWYWKCQLLEEMHSSVTDHSVLVLSFCSTLVRPARLVLNWSFLFTELPYDPTQGLSLHSTKIGLSSRRMGISGYILRMFYKRNMANHCDPLGLQSQVKVFPFLGTSWGKILKDHSSFLILFILLIIIISFYFVQVRFISEI